MLFRNAQNIQELRVVYQHFVVGHEQFEASDPAFEGGWQLFGKHFFRRVRDDQVVGVIQN